MKIEYIQVMNQGSIECKSIFYKAFDYLSFDATYTFSCGINQLNGEIDSGIWGTSYLLSMYQYRPKDFVIWEKPEVTVNKTVLTLEKLSKYTCYMDQLYPLFSSQASVRHLVKRGIKRHQLSYTSEEIRDLFHMDAERFERPIKAVGHEMFRAMAAIGYVHGKQVFCFPWLSQRIFQAYHGHMTDLLDILDRLDKIVILPLGS